MLLGAVILTLAAAQGDSVQVIQRLRSITSLAVQEYATGVVDGKVVARAEVDEARLFFEEARRTAENLPSESVKGVTTGIDSLLAMVARSAPPEMVATRSKLLVQQLATRFHVTLDELPPQDISRTMGAGVYAERCASCHGAAGKGDGFAGRSLSPRPTDLTDGTLLADASLLDFYRRVTIGTAGTGMPAFENQLTADERWAVAAYTNTLRVRQGERDSTINFTAIFNLVRRQLDEGISLAANGDPEGGSMAVFDAYMTFEQVERQVRARNAGLAVRLEGGFTELRTQMASGINYDDMVGLQGALLGDLENAQRTVSDQLSPLNLFTQSLVLLVREGLEAILVIGAIIAFLTKTGARGRRREIHAGVAAGVAASLVTAYILDSVLRASQVSQETLEGGIMVVAAGMLFYVSYWLLSRLEVARWNRFVRGQVQNAVTDGSSLALVSVAFLAVYREGFETVLFYKALLLSSRDAMPPVAAGMAVGAVMLGAVYLLINRFGVKIPLKPFFGLTSAFLYYMAFTFVGNGIAELQEGGVVGTTMVGWAPRVPALGIYPTAETLMVQGILIAALLAGLIWTFVIEPRRLKVTSSLVPEPEGKTEVKRRRSSRSSMVLIDNKREHDMIRSLERMDADLAELRAEVDRLKDMVRKSTVKS